jgi:cytochrome c
MAFAGLKDDKERANVIAYLRTLSDKPEPLPAPPADAATAEPAKEGTEVASAAPEAPAPAPAAEAPAPAEAPAAAPAPAEAPAAEAAPAAPASAEQQTAQTAAPTTTPAPAPAPEPAPAPAPAPEAAAPAAAPAGGDVAKGASYAKRCTACHSLDKGGPNRVGPHLYGVVGRHVASIADFKYSDAMVAFSEGGTKVWDEATLETYLTDPRKVVPGTKMIFPGIPNEADRANVIAYLKTLSE